MEEQTKNGEKTQAEEILELETLLLEKKRALEEKGIEKEPKEVFREVFKEYVEAKKALPSPAPVQPLPPVILDEQKRKAEDLKQKERQEQLEHLIGLSFEKGLLDAVTLAETMTPWLLDELHDRLVDEYYEKLLQSDRLKEL